MAYSTGGLQHGHADEAPLGGHHASRQGGAGGQTSEVALEGQTGGGAAPGGADGDPAGGGGLGLQALIGGGPRGLYGPGDGHDGSDAGGFMPNGEDGLLVLADFAQRGAANGTGADTYNNSQDNPGGWAAGGLAGDAGASNSDGDTGGGSGGGSGGSGGDAGVGVGGSKGGGVTGYASQGGGGGGGGGGGSSGGGTSTGGGGNSDGGSGGGVGTPGGGVGSGEGPSGPFMPPNPSGGPGAGGFAPPDFGGGPAGPAIGPGDGGICVVSAIQTCGGAAPTGDPPPGLTILTPNFAGPTNSFAPIGDAPSSSTPEPATWLTLLLGVGALGSVLRAHRRATRRPLA